MKIIKINNSEDERLDIFYRYKEEQLYKREIFIGESELIIERALNAGYIPLSFLIREKEFAKYQRFFNDDSDIYTVSDEVFSALKGYILTRGILACFKRKEELKLEDVLKNNKRIVVLEDVMNPTNVGAIFRNAIGLNADGLLLTSASADPLCRRSIRTAMGNVFNSKWCYVNIDNYIDELHKHGYKTVALALRDDAIDIDDKSLIEEAKLAIILGNEGYGMSNKTIDESDYVCKIKMNPNVDSLNVASASGIALYNLCMKKPSL